ncbi:Acyl-CoA dehydrogenase, C-terminal:Acyl-CoA dehydrogenase, centralregion:Acyl-CoA dehydrogenase, N-terminal [Pseudooceanicola batsensis HTCC2597]|uniref:Acyl-CoA dehydrogenase, C-terminal:Acyl-CoA dehydrogenase, centralregion:Acyl-CoA dehydrogenase, N-terminal n=1 Tax=Pseudooceanicola batsensis (strain ATCC BAA-863 / DSM 15984 / KCTC 12145 / HTCC2597) TaxID=252305 RepID=A3TZG8_PSEBH|nr:acyl-CoA dehydrogenase family protein [Pseudooceanicola batsensis]EAQ02449.1 Acyl-CoA dehydrogenase, C-terminal:Acyl-CoA dehydrogenase, centralregion:Acyl-CoA dehydrogenase, N-terminal [Pseudooceanicola batsensis HTCC2597]
MDFALNDEQKELQEAIGKVCAKFDLAYWRDCDASERYPEEFYREMVNGGWVGLTLPSEYGGAGLGITEAALVMQTIVESGAGFTGASTIHSYVFAPNAIVVHGTEEQKKRMLTPLIKGEERACFAITEPNSGLDTSRLQTRAVRKGDHYVMTGEKVWPTAASMAQRMLVIARTKPIEECERPIDGLSLFYTRMDPDYVKTRKIPKLGRNAVESCQIFIDGLKVPEEDRIGEEGKGFYYLLDGLNPERILVAAESVGLGRVSLRRATEYAKERVVFDRPIGKNQGIQHPLAKSWMELESANLMMLKAATLYDAGEPCGAEANSAKYLGAEAGYRACECAVMTHGGYGYAKEFDVERYLREVMIPRLAPVSRELVMCYIAERVLGLPKSY